MGEKQVGFIRFHFLVKPFFFPHRTRLKEFLYKLTHKQGKSVKTINYIFCDDAYLLSLNRSYLQHDTYTDIITFELSEAGDPLLADIYISVERVKENAREFHATFLMELHRVIFHGALHLCGFKDKTEKDVVQMRAMEELMLKQYFVPRNTVSR